MGKQTKPVTIPVDAFLRHNQPAQAPATALMRFDVPLSMNSFELVAKYLGIRFEDFQCRSHQSKGHEFHEVWVDLTKKWNCGIAIAYAARRRNALVACCAKIFAIFGRIDLARIAFTHQKKFDLFVGIRDGSLVVQNSGGSISRLKEPLSRRHPRKKLQRSSLDYVDPENIPKRAENAKRSQKKVKETKCPFLMFLNMPNAECVLWTISATETKLVRNCVEVQKSKINDASFSQVNCTELESPSFATSEIGNSSSGEVVHFLNMLPVVETIDIFTNHDNSTNLHIVKLTVNSLYSFYGSSYSMEEALESVKSRAMDVLQNLGQQDSILIPSDSYTDLVLLLGLIEDHTGLTPENLPVTFEFDSERKNWKAALKVRDSNTHYSDHFSCRSDAISDVIWKYVKNTFDVRCC